MARVTVGGAPFPPCRSRQLGGRQTLQGFHTGVIIKIVCRKTTDSHFIKSPAGRNEAFIIGWQRNLILFKKISVHYEAMRICAHRKPVYAAVLVSETVEVGIIDSTGRIRCGKIHQAVFERTGIVQGEPAAGYYIRQSAVFVEKPVEIQIIIPYYKFNLDIRQLFLDIGCIFFIQLRAPQIHRNRFCIFFFRTFCATARQ